jgi:hypothetical protein
MAISNTVLVVLVVVAILVSLGGTFMTLSMLQPKMVMTGAGITSIMQFEILSIASVNVVQTAMDFGAGMVYSNCTACYLNSNDSTDQTDVCYGSTTNACGNWSWTAGDAFAFEVENTGTVAANVTVQTNETAANFIGGTSPTQEYFTKDNETGSCSEQENASFIPLNTSTSRACYGFNHEDGTDQFFTHIRIKVPEDATTGSKVAQLTFTASSA